jgi:hypothetical protein
MPRGTLPRRIVTAFLLPPRPSGGEGWSENSPNPDSRFKPLNQTERRHFAGFARANVQSRQKCRRSGSWKGETIGLLTPLSSIGGGEGENKNSIKMPPSPMPFLRVIALVSR